MVEPLVLQIESTFERCSRAWRIACSVSAVSPDWLIATTRVSLVRIGSR